MNEEVIAVPELPEVETTRLTILPHLVKQRVKSLLIRESRLRWPVPERLSQQLPGAIINDVQRRGKYLLIYTNCGTLLIHLGMSGHLRVLTDITNRAKHDHIDLMLVNGKILRFTDPRRFGAWLWTTEDPMQHPLLSTLGPEPFAAAFNAVYLYRCSRQRNIGVKQLIMDNQVVVGVGNIYASEALFLAGIHPAKPANQLTRKACKMLVTSIQDVLNLALDAGGTTIRNFLYGENTGKTGYFKQSLWVYGREKQLCKKCGTALQLLRLGQRSSVFCPHCQR